MFLLLFTIFCYLLLFQLEVSESGSWNQFSEINNKMCIKKNELYYFKKLSWKTQVGIFFNQTDIQI